MVKSTLSMVIVALLIAFACFWEGNYIKNSFKDFGDAIEITYQKVENQTASKDDVYALQKNWLSKKKCLHTVVPHTEIKEIDLWLSETVMLVDKKEWTDALSKLEVLKELAEQIPKTFSLLAENIL